MPAHRAPVPAVFADAVESLRSVRLPNQVRVQEVPAPSRVAPFATALAAQVEDAEDGEIGSGRFVLLHDPAGQDAWDGTMRVVTFARADLEPEVGEDPLLCDIGWSWLTEQLADVPHVAVGGTVTRVLSMSYEGLADRPPTVELEIRASWTPAGADIGRHLQAWVATLCTVAGLPPLPEGVTALQRRMV
ncbi:MAG: enoyl-CoA hydratase [Micrococcales bacterium]|nr:MAG: enoyl-CoA hydratase [Micrococcales bacterium]PIE26964.1 MAG: enoyl-CoA hydratase [Micrococcales bacterium]